MADFRPDTRNTLYSLGMMSQTSIATTVFTRGISSFGSRVKSRMASFASTAFIGGGESHVTDERGKLRTIGRMALIVLLPTLALLGALAVGLVTAMNTSQRVTSAMMTLEQSRAVARLVTAIQVERGVSSAYVSTGATDDVIFQQLQNVQNEVDMIVSDLDPWVAFELGSGNVSMRSALEFARHLGQHRTRLLVFADSITVSDNIEFYSAYTRGLLAAIEVGINLPPVKNVWSRFVGYMAILKRTDRLGIIRALGSVYMTTCDLDISERYWLVQLQAEAEEFRSVTIYYYPDLNNMLTEAEQEVSLILTSINDLALEVMKGEESECKNMTSSERAERREEFFSGITRYLTIHLTIAGQGAEVVKGFLQDIVDYAELEVTMYSVFIAVMTFLCGTSGIWYGARVHKMASNIQRFARFITRKMKDLNVERRRTERLLYQMLPRAVADQLKEGLAVTPQSFPSVTIYFSDILGFVDISTSCSPHQVVDLLNGLYRLFDDAIDKYDAYKVETIADSYMVVSGLPSENGDAHAREIGLLALELQHKVKSFSVPHDPSLKLQLRVGIHSGPVVAGVIGTRMPRYCLFGDTVNTASRMQTNGKALRIHMSSAAHDLLVKHNGFVTQIRGTITVKGKGSMMTHWLISHEKMTGISGGTLAAAPHPEGKDGVKQAWAGESNGAKQAWIGESNGVQQARIGESNGVQQARIGESNGVQQAWIGESNGAKQAWAGESNGAKQAWVGESNGLALTKESKGVNRLGQMEVM